MRATPSLLLRAAVPLLVLSAAPPRARTAVPETDRVFDVRGRAAHLDSPLVDPWGILVQPNGLIRVADNGSGRSLAYGPAGLARGARVPAGTSFCRADDGQTAATGRLVLLP